jgi:predicted enzyme related to lactoylglutathione lyase
MAGFARLDEFVLECPDPAALAGFYGEMLGWSVLRASSDWVTIGESEKGARLSFQQSPGYQPPAWPDPASSMQFHLDLLVDDLDEAEERAVAIGATKYDKSLDGTSFRVFADPVGHPFCLCAAD